MLDLITLSIVVYLLHCRSHENPGESQCSYVLGDEHMEVRCGVVDPARVGLAKKAIPVDSSSEDSSSRSSSSGGSNSSSEESSSSDAESSDDSSSSEDDGDEGKTLGQKNGRSNATAPAPACPAAVTARAPAAPAGIPARGPAVLYRCRVLHGTGSTFLVLSCPNVAYVPAVRDHAIVRGARGKDR